MKESLIGYIIISLTIFVVSYYGDMLYQYLLDRKDSFNRGDNC
jgi:hypothetical protein